MYETKGTDGLLCLSPNETILFKDETDLNRFMKLLNDENFKKIDFRINRRPKSLAKLPEGMFDWEREIEHQKSAVRCMVEHPFQILKNMFHFRKVRYKGIAKNFNKLNILFACANLLMIKQGEINGAKLRKQRAMG